MSSRRIPELDVVRGLALCGILFVNIVGLTRMPTGSGAAHEAYELLAHQRFYPMFAWLFGVGAALFLRSAADRTDHPRLILLARFGFLIPFGMAHHVVRPTEVLLPYAIAGIIVILPASYLKRWQVALGAAVALAIAFFYDGGIALIPGMFLLGLATAPRGETLTFRRPAAVFAAATALALAAGLWQVTSDTQAVSAAAGVITAFAYLTGTLLILRTRAAGVLNRILAPLGRMTLTNYVMSTPLILAADQLVELSDGPPRFGTVLALGLVILLGQAIVSTAWLRRFRHGPLEWIWRSLTWWRPVPLRLPARAGAD